MNKIKKINLKLDGISHAFYDFLFLDVNDKISKFLHEKNKLIIYDEISIYCANNTCVIMRQNKIVKIIKTVKAVSNLFNKDAMLKKLIVKSMSEKIDFYETNNVAENIIFMISKKKNLSPNEIFESDESLRLASLLPKKYGLTIKENINAIKNKKKKKDKIIETLRLIEDEKLEFEIFQMGEGYNSSEYFKILDVVKNKEDLIIETLKNEKSGISAVYKYTIKELRSDNNNSQIRKLKIKAIFRYLIKSKKVSKNTIIEMNGLKKVNRSFYEILNLL